MEILLFLAMGLSVFAGVYLVGRRWNDRLPVDQQRALNRLRELDGEAPILTRSDDRIGSLAQLAREVGAKFAPHDGQTRQKLQERLTWAGFRQESAPLIFNGIQLSLVVVLFAVGILAAVLFGSSWRITLLSGVAGAAVGLLLPSMILSSIINTRQAALKKAFPDLLDLLVLSIEGGSTANAALVWASEELPELHPLLGNEVGMVQSEVQLGLPPSEAFLGLATRCGLNEARELSSALLQSERYGAGLAKAIRNYAETARQDRQMWAEEVAQKAAVKIIFPMLLCIFPAIFIVLLGPAASQMARLFAR